VEDAIYEHPSVASAVIIGVPHSMWGEIVMAVVTLQKGASLTLDELRAFLKPRIADYKIPRLIEITPALPMNVSGKVLKYKLREMFKDRAMG
jgi:acyl-CoA synthetase (AMP-forming)/AMP-acid ligase II